MVKTEFMLGLLSMMVDTLGSGEIPHVQERMGDVINFLQTLRACVRAAEADAQIDDWGVMCPAREPLVAARNMFAKTIYPRLAEIVQQMGSSSLMALPAEADFDTPIAAEMEQYFSTETASARERTKLFHLAWDVACSAFAGRQVLYERFFGGDPVRNAILLYENYDKEPAMQRIKDFLERTD